MEDPQSTSSELGSSLCQPVNLLSHSPLGETIKMKISPTDPTSCRQLLGRFTA